MGHPRNLPRAGSREIEVDPEFLRNFANQLQRDYDQLMEARHAESIQDSHPSSDAMGNYQAGQALHMSVKNARDHIGGTYSEFMTAYQNLINALRRSADNYSNAEQDNRTNTNRVGGGSYAV